MLVYTQLQRDRRQFLALTGLTPSEFRLLLPAFTRAYGHPRAGNTTLAGQPRLRLPGGGRHEKLRNAEQKLLFILVYLKTYPLHAVMAELFALSVASVNSWIHRLLPVLRKALDELGVLPERGPAPFARRQAPTQQDHRLIIDATERRRQRPKNPEKQALHYSGKKKTHTDKNVVVVDARSQCVGFLSQTYPGKTHEKRIADDEQIEYPPGTVLYKDTGFQGYEPPVKRTCQAKKKAAARRTHGR